MNRAWAGAGRAVVYGFAGMMPAIASDKLMFSPRLPKKWKRLAFTVHWHGKKRCVAITHEGVEVDPKD